MSAALILWSHALAALLFAALAMWAWRGSQLRMPRRALAAALALTALWALAVAGVGQAELVTLLAETLRDLGWIGFMLLLQRRYEGRERSLAIGTVYGVIAVVTLAALLPPLIAPWPEGAAVAILLRMLGAIAALVLVQALHQARAAQGDGPHWITLALAGLWLAEFALLATTYILGAAPPLLGVVRGLSLLPLGFAFGIALQRRGEWSVQVSRKLAYPSLMLTGIGVYFALLALATSVIGTIGGPGARIWQTAFILGATVAIVTLMANGWLRAWARVKLAKHLFRHRYDYRAEWTHFTATLAAPDGALPLTERIVKAVADLTGSPAGILLVRDGDGLGVGARWNWNPATLPVATSAGLAVRLGDDGRIVELDSVRMRGPATEGEAALPAWMLAAPEAWALVPLLHTGALIGAVLLARPPVARPLDWEDFDLLRVAGAQAASHLAEARAQEALAEAQRFDEFNRRFAFILHDLKNLVSQLTLTARNAERHADNPAFRADMVATLTDSAARMNALLARLSQHHHGRSEAPQPLELLPLVQALAAARRSQHAVVAEGPAIAARADPAALTQLLDHLVQNAIEASPPHAPVVLRLGGDGLHATIDVIDQGCGMSPAFVRDRLFKPFVSSKPDGFGIGAFEARQLAQAMDGRIEVESREGSGSRFRVVLKAAHAADVGQPRTGERAA